MSGPPAVQGPVANPPQPGVHGPTLHPHESAKGPAGNPGRATRILLVEDDPALAEIATLMLETLGYDVPAVLGEGEAACDVARREDVDLALLDVRLPGAIDGIEAGERIRAALDIPVVYATALQDEGTLRRAVASRPYGYIVKPYQSIDLRSAIELALERHRAEHDLAEREAEFRRVLESTRDVTTVLDPDGTIRYESPAVYRVMGYEPDALIGRSVFEFLDPDDIPPVRALLGRLVFRPDSSRTEQIRFRHQDGSWRVLEATGSAFRDSRGDLRVVVSSRDVSERVRLADELERMAFGDPLTKAANRRALERQGEKILALAERHRHRAALVYVDLARFKGVNDTLGHAAGDAYLVEVADRFREVARDSDVVARVGGDEFAVLFSEVRDEEGAASAARRLMKAL
ncbi:MAG: diguanylate cyclase domain-containing protein, partial [Gemmatimonadota bacterium]